MNLSSCISLASFTLAAMALLMGVVVIIAVVYVSAAAVEEDQRHIAEFLPQLPADVLRRSMLSTDT